MRSMNKMSAEDIAKLKAVALYVLDKCGETDFIHLFKIIYFAERNLYAKYGQHLVKNTKIWIPRLCLSYLMILPGMRHGIRIIMLL